MDLIHIPSATPSLTSNDYLSRSVFLVWSCLRELLVLRSQVLICTQMMRLYSLDEQPRFRTEVRFNCKNRSWKDYKALTVSLHS